MKVFSSGFVLFSLFNVDINCMIQRSKNPSTDINDMDDWTSMELPGKVESEAEEIVRTDILGEPLSPEEFHQADFLKESSDEFKVNPILMAGLFEGDIALSKDDLRQMRSGESRNAIRDSRRKWSDATIPYTISSLFSQHDRLVIAKAIKVYSKKTCIRFERRTSENDYVHIMRGGGCSSYVGRIGGMQEVSLAPGCVTTGTVVHELMHAAGFDHEQSRADRDEYVEIKWENIQSGREDNFQKYRPSEIDHLGASYDTCSLMHYRSHDFSKNNRPTIVTKKAGQCEIGQTEKLSDTDIRKLNTLYKNIPLCKGYSQVETSGTSCTDDYENCPYWAGKGFCKNAEYVAFMKQSCKKSCNLC